MFSRSTISAKMEAAAQRIMGLKYQMPLACVCGWCGVLDNVFFEENISLERKVPFRRFICRMMRPCR